MTRRARQIDVDKYDSLVESALMAFGEDVSYIIGMARSAVTIENKRDTWRKRSESSAV